MKTVKIQPINYGDPIVVGVAEYITFEFPECQYWFEDVNNQKFDGGAFLECTDGSVVDEATYEPFLLDSLGLTKE